MNYSEWLYWELIKKHKSGNSFERWSLRHLHQEAYLNRLAIAVLRYNKDKNKACNVRVNSIWVDGTPQAFGTARTNKVKCELADLLFIIEELDSNGDELMRKGILLQGKVTRHPKKIDSNNSTKKERTLFQKLDRTRPLTLRAGTKDSTSVIGSYHFDSSEDEGMYDCSRFLLMPKHTVCPALKLVFNDVWPFHITWPKDFNSNLMVTGDSLSNFVLNMYKSKNLGKPIVSPEICDWSRMVKDLENKYKGIRMNGHDRQQRIYSSNIASFSVIDRFSDSPKVQPHSFPIEQEELNNSNLPYISIIKVTIESPLHQID